MIPCDALADARVALAAATQADDDEVRVMYLAAARVALDKALAEARRLEQLLVAREVELARKVRPMQVALVEEP
jgi:hypothetical protein